MGIENLLSNKIKQISTKYFKHSLIITLSLFSLYLNNEIFKYNSNNPGNFLNLNNKILTNIPKTDKIKKKDLSKKLEKYSFNKINQKAINFPTKIPHVKSVKKYIYFGANKIIVHIRQKHLMKIN